MLMPPKRGVLYLIAYKDNLKSLAFHWSIHFLPLSYFPNVNPVNSGLCLNSILQIILRKVTTVSSFFHSS